MFRMYAYRQISGYSGDIGFICLPKVWKLRLPWVSNLFPPPYAERILLDRCSKEILLWEEKSWTGESTGGGGLNYSPTVKFKNPEKKEKLHVSDKRVW